MSTGQPLRILVDRPATGLSSENPIPIIAASLKFAAVTDDTTGVTAPVGDILGTKASIGHTAVPDVDYQVLTTDVHVAITVLTANRTVTLCDVDVYPAGQDLIIGDETGACSESLTITVHLGPGTNDTLPQTGSNTIVLATPYAFVRLRRGAANIWLIR